jgi:hypothetical protein
MMARFETGSGLTIQLCRAEIVSPCSLKTTLEVSDIVEEFLLKGKNEVFLYSLYWT